jgi:sugar lactone lactonase YvrE
MKLPNAIVPQTSKSAVSQVSKPAVRSASRRAADLEIGDTAGLETCGTREPARQSVAQPSTLNPLSSVASQAKKGQPIRGDKLLAGLVLGGMLGLTTAWGQADYATPYTFTTIAGTNGSQGFADGTNSVAQFTWPEGIVVATNGILYVVDTYYNSIREVAPMGTNWVVTTIAGNTNTSGYADGTGQGAEFHYPTSIALDRAGNLYVTDGGNNTVRKLTPVGASWVSSTIAGAADVPGTNDGMNGAARFNYPSGIAVDATGTNLYVADTFNDTIRRVAHVGANWVVSTIAGQALNNGSNDGTNLTAQFFKPSALTIDPSGNLFVADTGNSTVRRLTPMGANWVVTTIAGSAESTGLVDGTNADASFNNPYGIAVDANDNVYVADPGDNAIRLLSPQGTNWVTTTLAGDPGGNSGVADGTGPNALFNSPWGIAVDAADRVYEGETGNYVVRQGIVATVPNLAISPVTANSVVISWAGSSGFVLQTNGSLTAPNWGNYGGAVSSSNGTNSVTLSPPTGTLVFRLAN